MKEEAPTDRAWREIGEKTWRMAQRHIDGLTPVDSGRRARVTFIDGDVREGVLDWGPQFGGHVGNCWRLRIPSRLSWAKCDVLSVQWSADVVVELLADVVELPVAVSEPLRAVS